MKLFRWGQFKAGDWMRTGPYETHSPLFAAMRRRGWKECEELEPEKTLNNETTKKKVGGYHKGLLISLLKADIQSEETYGLCVCVSRRVCLWVVSHTRLRVWATHMPPHITLCILTSSFVLFTSSHFTRAEEGGGVAWRRRQLKPAGNAVGSSKQQHWPQWIRSRNRWRRFKV